MVMSAPLAALEPPYIRLDGDDNVAIVVNDFGLPAGTQFPCGLKLVDYVPQGHKVALRDLVQDASIRRYGQVIGYAERPIARGGWVEESVVRMPEPPALDALALATGTPAPQPPLEGFTFEGYRNRDGSVGTRNILAISTSVQCVAGTLEHAVKR